MHSGFWRCQERSLKIFQLGVKRRFTGFGPSALRRTSGNPDVRFSACSFRRATLGFRNSLGRRLTPPALSGVRRGSPDPDGVPDRRSPALTVGPGFKGIRALRAHSEAGRLAAASDGGHLRSGTRASTLRVPGDPRTTKSNSGHHATIKPTSNVPRNPSYQCACSPWDKQQLGILVDSKSTC
jgi:hypothetical protein